jgi:hypothetical protein
MNGIDDKETIHVVALEATVVRGEIFDRHDGYIPYVDLQQQRRVVPVNVNDVIAIAPIPDGAREDLATREPQYDGPVRFLHSKARTAVVVKNANDVDLICLEERIDDILEGRVPLSQNVRLVFKAMSKITSPATLCEIARAYDSYFSRARHVDEAAYG